jgi:hypothetical protein
MVMVMARGRPRRNEETAEGKSCMMSRLSTGATTRLVIGGEVKLGELGPNLAIVTSPPEVFSGGEGNGRCQPTSYRPPLSAGPFQGKQGSPTRIQGTRDGVLLLSGCCIWIFIQIMSQIFMSKTGAELIIIINQIL